MAEGNLVIGVVLTEELQAAVGRRFKIHREAVWGYDCDGKLLDGKAGEEYSGDIFWQRHKCDRCGAVVRSVEWRVHWWNTHMLPDNLQYEKELGKFNGTIGVYA